MKAFLITGAAVVGLLYLTSKPGELQITLPKKAPALPPPSSPPVTAKTIVPANITKSISDAMASLDPEVIKTTAASLDKLGFNQQAADLRAFSAGMMTAMSKA